jgi:hypothetical protein
MFFDPKNKGAIVLMALSMAAIFLSGLFFGFAYYIISVTQVNLEQVNCTLPESSGYADCQEWWADTIYKLFALKGVLIVFSYIFIFTLVIGMLISGYQVGGNPAWMGLYFLAIILLTYGGLLLSNVYRELITNDLVYTIMQPFTIYNAIMLNFPWFVGITGIIGVGLSIVNYQRTKVNEPDPVAVLDY